MPNTRTAVTAANALMQAQQCHAAGQFERAEDLYLQVLEAAPEDPEILHLLGVLHMQTQRTESGIELLETAIEMAPENAQFRYSLGVGFQNLNRLEEARDAYRQTVDRDRSHFAGWYNLAIALDKLGQPDQALDAARTAVRLDPGHANAAAYVAQLLRNANRFEDALAALQEAGSRLPDNPRILAETANVLSILHRFREGATVARDAIATTPRDPGLQESLGRCLQALGDIDGASAAYSESHRLRRADPSAETYLRSTMETTKAKLRHDIEQFRYLEGRGKGAEFADAAARFESVLNELPADLPDGKRSLLSRSQRERLGAIYNMPVHMGHAPQIAGGTINPEIDATAITRVYNDTAPGICHVDDLLRPEALDSLRRFCLESAIWYDFRHQEGYLGAYRDDGFSAPLLLQIAEELRNALPDIFLGHPVRQIWAYKYGAEMSGIATHADFAAVNVNFWITPDDANLDPESGGLIVHKAECPVDWTFRDYNSTDKSRVNAFIEQNSKGTVVVPHRQNRAVIFNSDLFHATDRIRFREGYENRRINVTLLYGDRHYEGKQDH